MLKTENFCILRHGILLLDKLLVLLHGGIVVGEVAVGEISDRENWLLGKLSPGSCD